MKEPISFAKVSLSKSVSRYTKQVWDLKATTGVFSNINYWLFESVDYDSSITLPHNTEREREKRDGFFIPEHL